ncbi:MAG: amidohydrolase family protein, partial [Candidatus Eremiobacteraeota bacterium]|nr:amidohydrolase family protein [Candidatus Eremiobacteraeota bacterium]
MARTAPVIDTVFERPRIYDGMANRTFETDVGIVDGRIALIGDLSERDAITRIDAHGLALAPGFIDVHSHSDELWLVDARCAGKILQGVTTEVGGNCGSSVAPLEGLSLEHRRADMRAYALDITWGNFDGFFAEVEHDPPALNVASLVGLGTVRRCVRGDREGPLDEDEMRVERRLVREAVEQGALGVSSGLIYVPSRFANLYELTECAREASAAGAPRYASHLRSEGDELLSAVEECLEIGRRAGVALQFSHHKSAWKRNWGKVERS